MPGRFDGKHPPHAAGAGNQYLSLQGNAPQRTQKAHTVGIIAGTAILAVHNIDRSIPFGGIVQPGAERDDLLFVGNGDIESVQLPKIRP